MWRRMTSLLEPHLPFHSIRSSRPPRARVSQWGRCLWRGAVSSPAPKPPPSVSGHPPVPHPHLQNGSSQLIALIGGGPRCRWTAWMTCRSRWSPHFGPPGMCHFEPTSSSGLLAANWKGTALFVEPILTKPFLSVFSSGRWASIAMAFWRALRSGMWCSSTC